jgi:tetratricopeptide (TPR) repeat protein
VAGERTPAALVSLLLAFLLPACAERQPSSPFIIRSGHGPIDAGHLPAPSKSQRQDMEHARREALAKRAAERPATLPSIERLDRGLRESLAALGRQDTAQGHILVARNYSRVHVYDAAFDQYSDALALDPRNVVAWDERARVWRHWGMIEPALSDVHRAIFYGPDEAAPRNTLGTILEVAGQCSGAREAYADALTRNPDATWARENLSRLACDSANPGNRAVQ